MAPLKALNQGWWKSINNQEGLIWNVSSLVHCAMNRRKWNFQPVDKKYFISTHVHHHICVNIVNPHCSPMKVTGLISTLAVRVGGFRLLVAALTALDPCPCCRRIPVIWHRFFFSGSTEKCLADGDRGWHLRLLLLRDQMQRLGSPSIWATYFGEVSATGAASLLRQKGQREERMWLQVFGLDEGLKGKR